MEAPRYCPYCKYFLNKKRCTAFPDRIPFDIYMGVEHRKLHPEQVGSETFQPSKESLKSGKIMYIYGSYRFVNSGIPLDKDYEIERKREKLFYKIIYFLADLIKDITVLNRKKRRFIKNREKFVRKMVKDWHKYPY